MKKTDLLNSISKQERLILFAVFLVSAIVRLKINFSTEYIGGSNGAYYLVLVRNLLEKGDLVYREFPLIFWLEAAVAYIPLKLGMMNMNSAIDFSSRVFDSVIPALSILPAHLITKKFLGNAESLFPKIAIASVSVFYISFFMLVSDFQKNSLGLLWLFWLLYWILAIHESRSLKNVLYASLFFLLTALTHYGCIGVAIAIVAVDLLITQALKFSWKQLIVGIISALFVLLFTFAVVNMISPWRLSSLLEIPPRIFNNPVYVFIINKQPALSPIDIITIAFVNVIAITSLILFVKRSKSLNRNHWGFVASMILISLFLASPFLSIEYAQRLYFVSYLTALPLLAFSYREINNSTLKKVTITLLLLILTASIAFSFGKKSFSNINKTLYVEMTKMKRFLPQEEKTLIVARHGMEFWSTWIFRNMAVRQDELSSDYWRWYNKVYFLIQKKDKAPFGPVGLFGKPFPEPRVPTKSERVFESSYFELYKCTELPEDFSIFKKRD